MPNHKRRRTPTLTSQLFNTDTADLVREARELADLIQDLRDDFDADAAEVAELNQCMSDMAQLPADDPRHVAAQDNCDSLSGKSKLIYQFGVLDTRPQLRITANSGGGMFSRDWVAVAEVIRILKSPELKESVNATAFQALFAGRSINSQSFLLAILKKEGAVHSHPERARAYVVADVPGFGARIQGLMDAGAAKVVKAPNKAFAPARKPLLKSPVAKS